MKTETQFFTFADQEPLRLMSGEKLGPVTVAYETYGRLSPTRDNAVLIFHALSGSQHAYGHTASVPGVDEIWTDECRIGWWNGYIGPGKAIDTERFFVICANYLGGCYGSTGPGSTNPETGKPYGSAFPKVQIQDIVNSQLKLLDHLRVEKLHACGGGSMGGLMALNLATRCPRKVDKVILIACGLQLTVLQRLHNFEQIFAIEEDLHFNNGDYYENIPPLKGLALARIISQKTFISLQTIERRSHREIVQQDDYLKRYKMTHQVESYMLHQGRKFVQRFDANTYLRIIEAWQHYDLLCDTGCEDFAEMFARCRQQQYLVFSIDSDVCFYPEGQHEMVTIISACGIPCKLVTVHSEKGHDSFLIEPELYADAIRSFMTE